MLRDSTGVRGHEGGAGCEREATGRAELSSYPRLCIRSPHTDSIAATDSRSSCDFHPPAIAERTNGLSLRVFLVSTQLAASCFSSARIRSGELRSTARCNAPGLESILRKE